MLPLTDDELRELLKNGEVDRVERKQSAADGEKIREAICAFANDLPGNRRPGVVFIGVCDDGSCANLQITDKLLLTLSDMRSDGNILPFPMMSVQPRTLDGCTVAVVTVEPASAPPTRVRGRVWIRVGPRRGIATKEEERRLSERAGAENKPFDLRPMPEVKIDDLDLTLFHRTYLPSAVDSRVLAENGRNEIEQLASLRLASLGGVPTVLGVLLLARSPSDFLPGAYVQVLRVDGVGLADPIRDEKRIDGPLLDQIRRLDEVLRSYVTTSVDVTSGTVEERHADYPPAALVQLAHNALLHRNYDSTNAPVRVYWFNDRIEFHSPGGPYGQVSVANFGQPGVTDYRNPNLAEAFKTMGFVQRFGVGIATARKELARDGNPPLELQPTEGFVLAIVRRRG